jgi:hypothetical protein
VEAVVKAGAVAVAVADHAVVLATSSQSNRAAEEGY